MRRADTQKECETNKKTKESPCAQSSESKERVIRDGSGETGSQLDLVKIQILVFISRTMESHKKIEVEELHSQACIFQTTLTAVKIMDALGNRGK